MSCYCFRPDRDCRKCREQSALHTYSVSSWAPVNEEIDMLRDTMQYKGFSARIMEAERLRGDTVHGLPPGRPLPVYMVDDFKEVPESWMKGPGVFVVPVKPNKGLWFDWTNNSKVNTAVIPTVKGCNPITGMQTSGFHMERYEEKCPKHNKPFKAERFCEECGYKWPFGNYVAAPNILWFDGFRSDDGSVRQFFFTEEELRDVATHMIGKENTVPAFGFAFYRPKEMREEHSSSRLFSVSSATSWVYTSSGSDGLYSSCPDMGSYSMKGLSAGSTPTASPAVYACNAGGSLLASSSVGGGTPKVPEKHYMKSMAADQIRCRQVAEVSVGAGAKIAQDLAQDPYALDTWKDTPDAAMTIYFVFEEVLKEMMSKGMNDFTGKPEGMLAGIPVG